MKDISRVVIVLDTAPPLTSCPTFVPNSTTLNVAFVASKPVPDIVSLLESDERSDVLMSTSGLAATTLPNVLVVPLYDHVSDTIIVDVFNCDPAFVGARCVNDSKRVVMVDESRSNRIGFPMKELNVSALNVTFVASKPVPEMVSLLESEERSDVLVSTSGLAATIFATLLSVTVDHVLSTTRLLTRNVSTGSLFVGAR